VIAHGAYESNEVEALLLEVDADRVDITRVTEIFGPVSLIVRYADSEQLKGKLREIPGTLAVGSIVDLAIRTAGRSGIRAPAAERGAGGGRSYQRVQPIT
jgi:acyl-CoA reductase-like NAD-dependent aldehyde dehydrogenase